MGAQIAALLAGQGVEVDLLDLAGTGQGSGTDRSGIARDALHRLTRMRPAPLYDAADLARIRPGNFEEDLFRAREADWVIEAVTEDPTVKRDLWTRLASTASPDAILSTNTSGLSVASIGAVLPVDARRRLLGTHFFNPPRYLHLLELVPGPDTDPLILSRARLWGERDLGKGTVVARDTPNFIANRIGAYALHVTLEVMERLGLDVVTVDALTGPLIGHPRSATFRTLDLVGLDTHIHVAENLAVRLTDPDERRIFEVPSAVRRLFDQGALGEKAGRGFYRREGEPGNRRILAVDPKTLEYADRAVRRFASVDRARKIPDLSGRLRTLAYADDEAGQFTWEVLSRTLVYATDHLEEVAGGDMEAVDRAMRWGFEWELGPFGTWEALGLAEVAARFAREGRKVPAVVVRALDAGHTALYVPAATSSPLWTLPTVPQIATHTSHVEELPGATLTDLGEDVYGLVLNPDHDAIGPDLIRSLSRAADRTVADARGLVLFSHGIGRFLVGANLLLVLSAAQAGDFVSIEDGVRAFQDVCMNLKYLPRPVVAAVAGMALGGGSELALSADRIVATPELYIGQVEAGAGVIPSGGGTKELLSRAFARLPAGVPWTPALAAGPSPAGVGAVLYVDPAPVVAQAFTVMAQGTVSRSAAEARHMGFLRGSDRVVPNPDALPSAARDEVLRLDAQGYRPPLPAPLPAPGPDVEALMHVAVDGMVRSGYASDYDAEIAHRLAHVLSGGGAAQGTPLSEERFLDLERETFLTLVGDPRTQARMAHLLRTGRPLRN